jgi:hypothetical protein
MDAVSRRTRTILLYALVAALAAVLPLLALALRKHPGEPTAAAPVASGVGKPRLPPPGGIVLARESGRLAVALSARRTSTGLALTATVLGPDGDGASGLRVAFRGAGRNVRGTSCGSGCYLARLAGAPARIVVVVGSTEVPFRLPTRVRPAAELVRRAVSSLRRARSLAIDERLASSPTHAIRAQFEVAAPDRLTYRIAGGAEAVVIGGRRWDRATRREAWTPSSQTPLRLPAPSWSAVRDAWLVARGRRTATVTFLDPTIPAWFELRFDRRTFRPLEVRMTAASHFMRDRYSRYNAPIRITPPRGGK